MGEGGLGGEGRGVLWNYYNIYLYVYNIYIFTILYGERCRSVALYVVVIMMGSVSTNIFLCFFCACPLCPFGDMYLLSPFGEMYLHLVSAVRPSKFSSYCIDFIPIFLCI